MPKPRPQEYCSKCLTPGYQQGGRKCWRFVGDGKTCPGTYRRADDSSDWELCDDCDGNGCPACDYAGWYLARPC